MPSTCGLWAAIGIPPRAASGVCRSAMPSRCRHNPLNGVPGGTFGPITGGRRYLIVVQMKHHAEGGSEKAFSLVAGAVRAEWSELGRLGRSTLVAAGGSGGGAVVRAVWVPRVAGD